MEMKLREGRDTAYNVKIEIVIEVLVDIIQHSLHPLMIVPKRCGHSSWSPWQLKLDSFGNAALDRSCGLAWIMPETSNGGP
ncbi:hypothetical protein ACCT24_32545 [Rhizobium ruizarguesonis]|uniref:hypothetical protein n=1 Tax=Rhizobium ruizarguesonis TaxID=2081791 RepID=UPI0003A81965|nr:hypothetical protein [Rhizobium ruizarguesonis]UFW97044.1 hypothetical protein RlegTA1_24385 [Rhizobium ruizarguesonis]